VKWTSGTVRIDGVLFVILRNRSCCHFAKAYVLCGNQDVFEFVGISGDFRENLTIAGLSEESVCIGDIFRIGGVTLQVSQPRQPCWKLARRWRMHELVGLVVRYGRTGWYLRVLEQGSIEVQMQVALIERPNPAWSIARANEILHHRQTDVPLTLELANVPGLADSWVEELRGRAERLRVPSARR
jgi:MOSC domain-containing protein YiiM